MRLPSVEKAVIVRVCYEKRKGHSNALMSSMPLMMRRRMSMHSLLMVIIFLKPAPHLKQSEEEGINILAAAHSKSSITYIRKKFNISTKARGCNPSENELWTFILKSSVTV